MTPDSRSLRNSPVPSGGVPIYVPLEKWGIPIWCWVLIAGTIVGVSGWLLMSSGSNIPQPVAKDAKRPAALPQEFGPKPHLLKENDRSELTIAQTPAPRDNVKELPSKRPVRKPPANAPEKPAAVSADPANTVTLADGTKFELEQWGDTYQAYEYRPPITMKNAKIVAELPTGVSGYFNQIALDAKSRKLYWTVHAPGAVGWLECANTDGKGRKILRKGINEPKCLALDLKNNKVYWSGRERRPEGHTIRRANLDGSGEEDVVKGLSIVGGPWEIALDVEAGKLYYVDQGVIVRANLDGSNEEDVLSDGKKLYGTPLSVALDPDHNRIYWGGMNFICTASLDGSGAKRLPVEVADMPWALMVDEQEKRLYWVDDFVYRVNLDGSNQECLIDSSPTYIRDVAIDRANRKIYWIDDNRWKIVVADLPSLPTVSQKPAPPRVDRIEPAAAASGDTVVFHGKDFTGTANVAFIDDVDGGQVQAAFKVESDDRITAIVPQMSERCSQTAVYIIADGGLTVTLPRDITVISSTVELTRRATDHPGVLLVREKGILYNLERRAAFAERGGIFLFGPRGGATGFLKNGASMGLAHSTGNTIYFEPFAVLNQLGEAAAKNLFKPVPAIRPSFLPALLEYKSGKGRQ